MRIRIIKPGVLTTIQDMGRWLYLSQAVPVSGVMDMLSARIANMALGNTDDAAIIEFTYGNAEFETDTDILIAWCGDGATLQCKDQNIPEGKPVFIPKGNTIKLVNNSLGSRTYLAIAGGWDVPDIMGSRSTYLTAAFGGLHGRALQGGDILNGRTELNAITQNILNSLKGEIIKYPAWGLSRRQLLPAKRKTIRVVPAHEFTWFDGLSIINFLSEPYTLSLNSNRMGYHLEGPPIERIKKDELLSTAVTPGTIQVTGNGSMIMLMADCQTTGGYPRIAQVAAVDMPLCAQFKPGDTIYFEEISRQEAEILYIERENELNKMRISIKNKIG